MALLLPALAATALQSGRAHGAEVTRVVSALDDDNRFDFNLTLSFVREWKSAFIKRESQSDMSPTTQLIKDLQYQQARNVLDLRADFGIFRDVGVHIEAPLVLSDDRQLQFDQSASSTNAGCIFPGQGPIPTCVNEQNATILRDGILPGAGQSQYGLDAQHPGRNGFVSPSQTVFRGPTRSGIQYLCLGLSWAPFNQARDDTKPTWTIGADAKLDVAGDMRFDPANPTANTAVGLGYHQFLFSTAVSKRFRYFDPYFGAWYMLPVRSSGSPYQSYVYPTYTPPDDTKPVPVNPSSVDLKPQQQAGIYFGVEQIAWEDERAARRVTVELRGQIQEHFFGASQSELWEPLSGSSKCTTLDKTACRPGLDIDPGTNRALPYPGVTETESYATFGADAGVNIQVGKYIRFRGLFGLSVDQPHFITFADAGRDITLDDKGNPANPQGGGDGKVDLVNKYERSPIYRETIDTPGRRFRVEGTQVWRLFLEGSLMF